MKAIDEFDTKDMPVTAGIDLPGESIQTLSLNNAAARSSLTAGSCSERTANWLRFVRIYKIAILIEIITARQSISGTLSESVTQTNHRRECRHMRRHRLTVFDRLRHIALVVDMSHFGVDQGRFGQFVFGT